MRSVAAAILLTAVGWATPGLATDGAGEADSTRWALVLSGGSARGLAHIGVLRSIEELGLRPDLIVGTSMGSIVGALYASGRTAAEIEAEVRAVDWEWLFFPRRDVLAWRGLDKPRAFLRMEAGRGGIQVPSAYLDDAQVNHLLARLFLGTTARSGERFDGLPIPLLITATDLGTADGVVLDRGDLARAVRASSGIPLIFPPIEIEGHILVDGGMSRNTPLQQARDAGFERIVASDVAQQLDSLVAPVGGVQVIDYMIRHVFTRQDAATAGPGDLVVRHPLEGYSPADFTRYDSLVTRGYNASREPLAAWARRSGLTAREHADSPPSRLPPLAPTIEWSGLNRTSARSASGLLGELPTGEFDIETLRRRLDRLHRDDVFRSVWPRLSVAGDSTLLHLTAEEYPWGSLGFTAAWGNDELERFALGAEFRGLAPFARYASVRAIERRYGRELRGDLQTRSLRRGAPGAFVRGVVRRTETRIYSGSRIALLPRTERDEVVLGVQIPGPRSGVGQFGIGALRLEEGASVSRNALFTVKLEAYGSLRRTIEAELATGPASHARIEGEWEARQWIGRNELRSTLRAGWVDGSVPLDSHVGVGGPESLGGLHRHEWLGRRMAALDMRLLQGLGSAVSLFAAGQLGYVADAISATEIGPRPQAGAAIGATLVTPIGPIQGSWSVGYRGRTRVDIMLGDRF